MMDSIMMSARRTGSARCRADRGKGRTVEDGADDGAEHLHEEGHARRELDVLAELQVLEERDALDHGVLPVERAVHVRDGLPGEDVRCTRRGASVLVPQSRQGEKRTSDHLEEARAGRRELVEADRGGKHAVEGAEDEGDDDEHSERPPGHARVACVVRRLRDRVRTGEHAEVPPARDLLVYLDLLVVLHCQKK